MYVCVCVRACDMFYFLSFIKELYVCATLEFDMCIDRGKEEWY